MSITNTAADDGELSSSAYEPAMPPGLEPPPSHPRDSPTPTPKKNDELLTVEIPSASTSSASSPVIVNHSDAELPRPAQEKAPNCLTIDDGCPAPHVVFVDDMDPELVKEIVRDPQRRWVATSSGDAALELKKRFNNAHGLSEAMTTLYTITSFTNQYGKSMYRVEPRGMSAPAASGIDAERNTMSVNKHPSPETAERLSAQQKSPRAKNLKPRSSIMRISMFGKGNQQSSVSSAGESSGAKGHTHGNGSVNGMGALGVPGMGGDSSHRNRLRKSRSNSDFGGLPPTATGSISSVRTPHGNGGPEAPAKRQHSHTVSGSDLHAIPSLLTRHDSPAILMPSAHLDPLGEVMQRGRGSTSPSVASPNGSLAPSISASSVSISFSVLGDDTGAKAAAASNPFGPEITFDSPPVQGDGRSGPSSAVDGDGENTPDGLLPPRGPPPALRVMQSFESGMTARAGDHGRPARSYGLGLVLRTESDIPADIQEGTEGTISPVTSEAGTTSVVVIEGAPMSEPVTQASQVDLETSSIRGLAAPAEAFLQSIGEAPPQESVQPTQEEPKAAPAATVPWPESLLEQQSQPRLKLLDSTLACVPSWTAAMALDTFDMLQNSRGMPPLDSVLHDQEKVLSISLETEVTAQPKNDPRFVIWGDLGGASSPSKAVGGSHASAISAAGPIGNLAHSDSAQRLRSNSSATAVSHTTSSSQTSDGNQSKIMVAATIERWVAQLTSTLNYDELLVFFLTYRVYITAYDVAELLICRFHWALGQGGAEQDESVRKIVRVRTFVAFKYWITKFFTVDFVPNPLLRKLLSQWLNTLRRDPIMDVYKDAGRIIRKLIRTIKDARDEYERDHPSRVRRSTTKPVSTDGEESDLETDFLADSDQLQEDELPAFQSLVFKDGPNERTVILAAPTVAPGAHLPPGVQVVPAGAAITATFATNTHVPTSALSRALTNTIGRMRISRWKRALSSRPTPTTIIAPAAKVSAFDLDLTIDSDMIKAGTLREVGAPSRPVLAPVAVAFQPTFSEPVQPPPANAPPVHPKDASAHGTPAQELTPLQPVAEAAEEEENVAISPAATNEEEEVPEPVVVPAELDEPKAEEEEEEDAAPETEPEPQAPLPSAAPTSRKPGIYQSFDDAPSYRSSLASSRFSYHSQDSDQYYASPPGLPAPTDGTDWRLNITNDADFSDYYDSEDEKPPARPNKLTRAKRMPRRGEFELVRRSESISSFGAPSRSSVTSAPSVAEDELLEPITVQEWHLEAMADELSEDEEAGDREAALRRIEGQVDPNYEKAKKHKAEGWVRQIREQQAAGIRWQPSRGGGEDSDEEDYGEQQESTLLSGDSDDVPALEQEAGDRNELLVPPMDNDGEVATPLAEVPPPMASSSTLASSVSGPEVKPPVEEAVPLEILQSRVALAHKSPAPTNGAHASPPLNSPPAPRVSLPGRMNYHRSFVLDLPSLVLAEHFAMIDRELFLAIKFEELTDDGLLRMSEEANVLDWAQFLKDRATARAERRFGPLTMSLVAVRARFNLLASFVASEILLAHPHDRARVHSKFLRIAWKAQQINSFGTLVAVMHGLQSEWVNRAMQRHYQQLPVSDHRIFRALENWVASDGDFKYIKDQVETLKKLQASRPHASSVSAASEGINSGKRTTSEVITPSGGVPFIGVYLQQLRRIMELPDLIDPTAPRETVTQDSKTLDFNPPAHPEVFAALPPLPSTVHLSLLVNVQKQRRIANVVKSLVDGQHLASRVQYAVDRKVYQRCLRLRAMNFESMQRALDQQGL